MPLTANQITAFFETAAQMHLSAATRAAMVVEGIDHPEDLRDFDKETIDTMARNLRRLNPPVPLGAKSQKRLTVTADLVKFYFTVGRAITADNLQWATAGTNFELQWKALKEKRDGDAPKTPIINMRSLPVMKWLESFRDVLHECIGARFIPLSYVIRELEQAPAIGPTAQGMPHSANLGSVRQDLITHASFNHSLYAEDNSQVYQKVTEAVRRTICHH